VATRRACVRSGAGALLCVLLAAVAAGDARGELTRGSLEPLTAVVERQIEAGAIPGAVVLVGQRAEVLYRRAAGNRELFPKKVAMTEDTIFDLASLTKVVATGTAILQLVESRRLALDEPAAEYWPEFAANGKALITVRQLLTHTSGLRADIDTRKAWSGYYEGLRKIAAERPIREPGAVTIYSDINFQVLGELVRRTAGLPLDEYCARFIFGPLGMKDTGFCPPPSLRDRIAPTSLWRGAPISGTVHDPTACRMGGVAGNAGLFGTADDLARFAQMMLGGGSLDGVRILAPETVAMMTSPQTPSRRPGARGLAWDLDTPFGDARGEPAGVYGHTGYTGTSLWIDPASGTYAVILSNRVYPYGRGDARPLRREVAAVVEAALGGPHAKRISARLTAAPARLPP
jgi:CubicO group peptidase (beta-lactamase class C family)